MQRSWQPNASVDALHQRAKIIAQIRQFFNDRDVLEVDTPLLSHGTVTDPYVSGIPALFKEHGGRDEKSVYLQTSPEYAMKRLLAAGLGSIYQICKAFRQGDVGKFHNPEFTILEWYRLGFDHHDLMNEMDELLQAILKTEPAERVTYTDAFQKIIGIDPNSASVEELIAAAKKHGIDIGSEVQDRNTWLDLLSSQCIESQLGQERPLFLYDFPATKAMLAKVRLDESPPLASRFEVYFKGIELANGFHELQNAEEQRGRFEKDLNFRAQNKMPSVPLDERFLAALVSGIPDCAGVALGVDRLVMLALKAESLSKVISFSFDLA